MRPIIEVLADGKAVNGLFYSKLISATIRDESGQESDQLTLVFDYRDYAIEPPKEGTILEPKFGYAETGLTSMGKFEVDSITSEGGNDGIFLTVTGHAASLRKKLKQKSSQHFDDTTLGAMLKKVFSKAGETIEVDGELASKKVKYEARFDQSALDFATRMADKYNAIFKAGGGKFLFVPRGSQKKASGGTVSTVHVHINECASWSIESKPRPNYSKVAVKWYDEKKGQTDTEEHTIGGDGPVRTIKHKARDKAEAKEQSKAEAARLNRGRGSGQFTQYGRLDVSAEADVIAEGFGPIENGKWRCKAVEHTFDDGGFTTTIEVEAPETPKN